MPEMKERPHASSSESTDQHNHMASPPISPTCEGVSKDTSRVLEGHENTCSEDVGRHDVDHSNLEDEDGDIMTIAEEDAKDLSEFIQGYNDLDIDTLESLRHAERRLKEAETVLPPRPYITRLPEVVDDYIRNFLIRSLMHRTLQTFESEWYELHPPSIDLETDQILVPDVYVQNTQLEERIATQKAQIERLENSLRVERHKFNRSQKECEFHKLAHHRAVQERDRLMRDIKRLQAHAVSIEPVVVELRQKYENALNEKVIVSLERDKLSSRLSALENTIKEMGETANKGPGPSDVLQTTADSHGSIMPKSGLNTSRSVGRNEPHSAHPPQRSSKQPAATLGLTRSSTNGNKQPGAPDQVTKWPIFSTNAANAVHFTSPSEIEIWTHRNSFRAHTMTVTSLAHHPRKPMVVTGSDDGTWKLFSVPHGELIMGGEGHTSWISSVAVHPHGSIIASASADRTVKLWGVHSTTCQSNFLGHTELIWSIAFHCSGLFLASASQDHTVKIWDVTAERSVHSLRGHSESVNHVTWIDHSNTAVTSSGDKKVCMWDARTNHNVHTFLGHTTPLNAAAVTPNGALLATSDANGTVALWEIRMLTRKREMHFTKAAAGNSICFDPVGSLLAIASLDGMVRVHDVEKDRTLLLRGHDGAVQDVVFEPPTGSHTSSTYLLSCGSDMAVRYWST